MDIVLAAATLALTAVIAVLAAQLPQLAADPGGPTIFPLTVALITGAACILLLAKKWRDAARRHNSGESRALHRRLTWRKNARPLTVIVLVLLFPVGIEWIGFTPAVLVFTFLTMLVSGKSLIATTITSVLVTVGVYVAYVIVLGAVLPQGELVARLLG